MKKFTSRLFPGIAAAALFAFSSPQSAVADTMLVSYGVTLDDAYAVYPYTGFCTTEDVKDLTIAVKFAESKIGEYAGSQLKSIYIGWSGVHQGYTPEATAFVRTSLNGENDTQQVVSLTESSGWNKVVFDKPYEIKSGQDIYVGYTVDMQANVYGPCTLTYGDFPEGTHFISRPDYKDSNGNPEWIDLSTPGLMDMQCPIMILAEIEISGSTDFQNRAVITQAATPCLMTAGETATAAIELKNTGSNDISSITVSCAQEGKEVWSEDFPLPQDISKNTAAIMTVPVNVSDKGDVTLSISKINGEPNGEKSEYKFSPLVISKDISSRYTRRPLVEYVVSESNYRSVGYDEEIVTPGLDRYIDRVTRINWHCDDQFQLGLADDRDYVLDLLIDMAEGDKMKVYIPTLMLDRSMNLGISPSYCLFNFSNPMMGVLYSPGAEDSYEYALAQPTFASVDVTFDVAGSQAKINVSGEADLSVLPENEQMMMTVVLVEDGIESDSQEYPGGDGESSNPGHAVHNYLVRQCLTGINGQPVEMNGNKFSKSFSTELDYDNVPSKMRAVAFLHRNVKNSNWERTVINSAESVASGSGIDAVEYTENNLRPIVADNRIIAPVGSQMSVYAASGVEVSPESLGAGIYIVKVKSGERNASFKVYVK